MTVTESTGQVTDFDQLAEQAIALVREWLEAAKAEPVDPAAARLAGLLRDENGLSFTVGFVDKVVRPEDYRVAAASLRELSADVPKFLGAGWSTLVKLGGFFAPLLPGVVVPIARKVLRNMVGHLIVDATDARLGHAIAHLRKDDTIRLNLNLLGEAVLGREEAGRRLEGTLALLRRPDVDYVSIKVSATVAPHTPWAFDEAVTDATEALRPLYRAAVADGTFINLDMEEYKDLELTIAVFTKLLDEPEFAHLEAGIVLQSYLPDALSAMMRLQAWASQRVARGGSPIKVRVVKGANLPMEKVEAESRDWPLTTWPTKQATDASYKAVLNYALRPEHVKAVRIGAAGHNLFDQALNWLLAKQRGVTDYLDIEMLLGMAPAQQAAVRKTVGKVLLYTPVVHPAEFDVAIAYLIRRLEEGASSDNFMSAVFELDNQPALFLREQQRFLAALASRPTEVPAPNRTQNRAAAPEPFAPGFHNAADSDPSLPANLSWSGEIRSRMQHSTVGQALVKETWLATAAEVEQTVARAVAAGKTWQALPVAERAAILHRAADGLQQHRSELLEVMGAEAGKVLEQSDPEVSEAIDFANYYAEQALSLAAVPGAQAVPVKLTVVTPPWNFPVAIPAGSTLAALAAGSPVIFKPAPQAVRCGALIAEILWAAGVPRDVLQYVRLDDAELGRSLVAHPSVERVILTGSFQTAELFRSFRPDLGLLAETSGKNAIIVTPSADLDLAAKDVAYSAFGHAGQKCSAASLVVLVGSVATSPRFRRQLLDAAASYEVGQPWDGASRVGPLIEPASGKLLKALTTLEPGQSWLLEPKKLDEAGQLWRPGIREGVQAGSEFHQVEYFGPVLGVMTADTLTEAIEMVNAVEYGLTSGLHSLDVEEIDEWLATIAAGNLYVNRGITGAIVERQPFGGWKASAVGAGSKAGGPNYLVGLTDWIDQPLAVKQTALDAASEAVVAAARNSISEAELVWLSTALSTDIAAWDAEFGQVKDVAGLITEQNAFRYQAVPVTVRFDGAAPVELLRVVAAGLRAEAVVTVSAATELPAWLGAWLKAASVSTVVETDGSWFTQARKLAAVGGRVRLLGGDSSALAAAVGGSVKLAIYDRPVLSAGRVELLTFLREQAVSISAHRFGTPVRYEVPALAAVRS
jgi:RHH-type transcriptional regulator, proline utilization regulon repressor / proline dehydrogenase / delta 1-pyrroline-5-carboxylate dehydrogenase